jgi:hypothetical protein
MAWSTNTQILDPAILAVLIETAGTKSGAETASPSARKRTVLSCPRASSAIWTDPP